MRFIALAIGLLLLLHLIWAKNPPGPEEPPPVADAEVVADPTPSLLGEAAAHVYAREYWASPAPEGLQAPNRRHELRSWFEQTGVRVDDRTASGSPRLVELRLAGIGRGEELTPVPPGEVTHDQGRVELRRDGLVEWFENSDRGLEQGFTLTERPATATAGDLVLELAVYGARASASGEAM